MNLMNYLGNRDGTNPATFGGFTINTFHGALREKGIKSQERKSIIFIKALIRLKKET